MTGGAAARLGQWGERQVRKALERQGVTILATNWRCPYGEIDIIAATETELYFVEVKTRRSRSYMEIREAVDRPKQRKLLLAAESYLQEHPEEIRQPRFDVAEVYAPQGTDTFRPEICYYPNAFDGSGG